MCPGACLLCSDVTFGTLDNLEEILKNGNELEVMIPEQPVPQQQATANPVQSGQISPVCVTQKVYTVIVPTKARQSNTVQQPVPQASTDVDAIAAAAELEKREEREEIWLELEKRERRDLVEQERRASAKEFEERQRKVDDSGFSSLYSGVSTEDEDLLNDSKSVHGAVSENSQNQENEDMDDGGPNQPDNDGDNASGITLKNSITAIRR